MYHLLFLFLYLSTSQEKNVYPLMKNVPFSFMFFSPGNLVTTYIFGSEVLNQSRYLLSIKILTSVLGTFYICSLTLITRYFSFLTICLYSVCIKVNSQHHWPINYLHCLVMKINWAFTIIRLKNFSTGRHFIYLCTDESQLWL